MAKTDRFVVGFGSPSVLVVTDGDDMLPVMTFESAIRELRDLVVRGIYDTPRIYKLVEVKDEN